MPFGPAMASCLEPMMSPSDTTNAHPPFAPAMGDMLSKVAGPVGSENTMAVPGPGLGVGGSSVGLTLITRNIPI